MSPVPPVSPRRALLIALAVLAVASPAAAAKTAAEATQLCPAGYNLAGKSCCKCVGVLRAPPRPPPRNPPPSPRYVPVGNTTVVDWREFAYGKTPLSFCVGETVVFKWSATGPYGKDPQGVIRLGATGKCGTSLPWTGVRVSISPGVPSPSGRVAISFLKPVVLRLADPTDCPNTHVTVTAVAC